MPFSAFLHTVCTSPERRRCHDYLYAHAVNQHHPERHDPTDSFILQFEMAGGMHGPLTGCTLAVKDLFE